MSNCPYCHEDVEGNHESIYTNGEIYIYENPKKLCILKYGIKSLIPINYCPMCGRKLGD